MDWGNEVNDWTCSFSVLSKLCTVYLILKNQVNGC